MVADAMVDAITNLGNPGRGTHTHALAAARMVFSARKTIADFFGTSPMQTVFTSGATDSLNIAIRGLLRPGEHVISTVLEHNSVLRPLHHNGVDVTAVGLTPDIDLDYTGFSRALTPKTVAVVITTASNVTGLVVDMDFVCDFCKRHGLLLIVDTAQTAGLLPADTAGVDVLCFTGHKALLGPQGVGGLCVKNGLSLRPYKVGGTGTDSYSQNQPYQMPEALEAGTLNMPGIAGLSAGVCYITATGLDKLYATAMEFADTFYTEVLRYVQVYCGRPHLPIVALNIGDYDSVTVEDILASEYSISARGGVHCAPKMHTALGTASRGAVRFSFSSFNTWEDVEQAIKAVNLLARS